ncbi:MAG TPA: HAD family hydrolase [Ktedonobacterales bacterium]
MGPLDLAVFDLAGTTIDGGGGAVLRCLVETALRYDLSGSETELNALMGMNKREVFSLLAHQRFPQDGQTASQIASAALASFVAAMNAAYEQELTPIAGAEETFAFLRARGIKVAIDTGFDDAVGAPIMRRLDWPGRRIDLVVYSSDVARGRPAPYMIFHAMERLGALDVRRVMKLGDSPADLEEGHNAGCGEIIGVLSGSHTAATLSKYPHTRLIDSVADLPALFS